jgi:hypothetical protein
MTDKMDKNGYSSFIFSYLFTQNGRIKWITHLVLSILSVGQKFQNIRHSVGLDHGSPQVVNC